MSALLESLARGFEGDDARRATLDAALRDGLPKPRSEAWKYTSLRALERRVFAPAAAGTVDAALLAGIDGPRLVFVNGAFDGYICRILNRSIIKQNAGTCLVFIQMIFQIRRVCKIRYQSR